MASPFVRALARAAARIFYRVDCVGDVPAAGATLLLPNHANALLDPAIIWATAGRDVRFLAKSTLFHTPLRPLLAGAAAIPVYRKLDQGVDTSKNTATFAAVEEALAKGDAVCVFPEGISHSAGRLVPLRTGAARMALAAERRGTPVAIVPVGLNFDRKTVFRSRVIVVYGRSFSCRDLVSSADDPEAVRALTDRMADQMRRLLVEADPAGDAELVERVDRLYTAARNLPADPEERVARRRAIAAGLERLRAGDPQRYQEIFLKLRRYDERLRRFGLRDRHLDWHISTGETTRFAIRELEAALVLVPVALAGVIVFGVPYFIVDGIARWFQKHPDVEATAKLLVGAAVYALWTAATAVAVGFWFDAAAGIATAVAMPLLAIAALLAIERETAVIEAIKGWALLRRTSRGTRKRLRRHRSELADVLDDVYEWLSAKT